MGANLKTMPTPPTENAPTRFYLLHSSMVILVVLWTGLFCAQYLLDFNLRPVEWGTAIAFSLVILALNSVGEYRLRQNANQLASHRKYSADISPLVSAVRQSPLAVMITNTEGEIEYVNTRFTEMTGYTANEVIGRSPKFLCAYETDPIDYADMWQTLQEGNIWQGTFFNRRKDGTTYWEGAAISPILDKDSNTTHFLAIKEDISARKETEAQLEMTATVFEVASEAIMFCDADLKIETVNKAFSDITGYSAADVIGKTPSLLKSGRHDAAFYRQMFRTLQKEGRWDGEIWNRRKNGALYAQWLSIKTVKDHEGNITRYVSLFSDITNRKRNEERILYQAHYDNLTGLPNRSLFKDRLQHAVARADRHHTNVALLFIDLDRFKNVNDTLGHAAGDLLLKEAAERLSAIVRKSDTVARLGGDEFTVILTDLTDYRIIENIVDKLLNELSAPYSLDNNIAYVSASIGITVFPNDARSVEDLLKNADTAMYRAKENGRNLSQFFTQSMNEEAYERRQLENALHHALEREEFALHYQPIVDTHTGVLTSCEVLLRWLHPEYGNVPPDKFIPLAEDTGLILPIGEWVLRKACWEATNWAKHSSTPPNIAINLSSRQFQRMDMSELVRETLEETGLTPERVSLEITESLLMEDDHGIIRQLNALRTMGIGLSIDDFGTGYSSLSYLRRFPISTLKIDRAFIKDLHESADAKSLVGAILSMAQNLNLNVIAEGVEQEDQLLHLQEENCTFIQGFYFSPPLPIEAFREMVKKTGPLESDE